MCCSRGAKEVRRLDRIDDRQRQASVLTGHASDSWLTPETVPPASLDDPRPPGANPATFLGRVGIEFLPNTELPPDYYDLDDAEQREACDRVNHVKQGITNRSLGQYRADILAEIILTGTLDAAFSELDASTAADSTGSATWRPTNTRRALSGIQANISIIIPAGGTATLEGYGPIDTETARAFAAVAPGWDTTTLTPTEKY